MVMIFWIINLIVLLAAIVCFVVSFLTTNDDYDGGRFVWRGASLVFFMFFLMLSIVTPFSDQNRLVKFNYLRTESAVIFYDTEYNETKVVNDILIYKTPEKYEMFERTYRNIMGLRTGSSYGIRLKNQGGN